jgi:hypothetical protein
MILSGALTPQEGQASRGKSIEWQVVGQFDAVAASLSRQMAA